MKFNIKSKLLLFSGALILVCFIIHWTTDCPIKRNFFPNLKDTTFFSSKRNWFFIERSSNDNYCWKKTKLYECSYNLIDFEFDGYCCFQSNKFMLLQKGSFFYDSYKIDLLFDFNQVIGSTKKLKYDMIQLVKKISNASDTVYIYYLREPITIYDIPYKGGSIWLISVKSGVVDFAYGVIKNDSAFITKEINENYLSQFINCKKVEW